MSSTFTDSARSSLAFGIGDAGCCSEVTPSGAPSLISMSASSNTNSNANNDVVEIIGRLAGNDPLLNRSPLSSGQSTPYSSCSSPELNAEMQIESPSPSPLNIGLPTTSPIAGDLPAKYAIPTATSPSLGFQMPANENGGHSSIPHSPNIPTTAAQFLHNSKLEMLAVTRSSISPTATLSPTDISSSSLLFQQNMTFDPLSLSSGVLLPPTLAMSQDEEDDEPQVCLWDNCGKEFPSLSSLVSHLDRGHTLSMAKYICFWKDCPRNLKPFDARYKLITHLRCHTGEKPYSCGKLDCGRSFSRLENLKLHVRTHTGEKPYVCHYEGCDKRFNNTSDRAKHMKTHITRKPYACKFPGCGKSYTDPSSMRKHVKYTHKLREKQMLDEEGAASVIRIHRSPRKSSSASRSSTSSTPQSSPGIVIYPTPSSPISGFINVTSPVGTTFPSNARILQTVQSPPTPPSTNTINQQSSSLTAAGVSVALTNPTPAPLVSMPFFQLPGQNAAQLPSVPQGVQSVRPLLGTQQQPIVMFLPAANNILPQKIVAAEQGIPTRVTSNGLTWSSEVQPQGQGLARDKESGEPTDPTAVEKQLRMQIALLQQQLANSQQQQQQRNVDESNLRGASPSMVSTVTTTAAHQPQVVRILQPAPNSLGQINQSPVQTQLPMVQAPVNHAIPTQFPQYIPISNLATAHQLKSLNIATTTSTSNNMPLTVLNSAPILGLPPPTSGQTLLPQFVVPGTQVIPIVRSPGVTPQIMYIAPSPQVQPLNGKT